MYERAHSTLKDVAYLTEAYRVREEALHHNINLLASRQATLASVCDLQDHRLNVSILIDADKTATQHRQPTASYNKT